MSEHTRIQINWKKGYQISKIDNVFVSDAAQFRFLLKFPAFSMNFYCRTFKNIVRPNVLTLPNFNFCSNFKHFQWTSTAELSQKSFHLMTPIMSAKQNLMHFMPDNTNNRIITKTHTLRVYTEAYQRTDWYSESVEFCDQ